MNQTTGGVKNRKIGALVRLEAQLVRGTKITHFKDGSGYLEVPLTEEDTKRINSEISILKEKIKKLN